MSLQSTTRWRGTGQAVTGVTRRSTSGRRRPGSTGSRCQCSGSAQFQGRADRRAFVESLANWTTTRTSGSRSRTASTRLPRSQLDHPMGRVMNLFVADRIPVVPRWSVPSGACTGPGRRAGSPRPAVALRRLHRRRPGRAEFEQDRRVRILMDNGRGTRRVQRAHRRAWEMNYDSGRSGRRSRPPITSLEGQVSREPQAIELRDLTSPIPMQGRPTLPATRRRTLEAEPRTTGERSPKAAGSASGAPLKRDTVIDGASSSTLPKSRGPNDIQATLRGRPGRRETYVKNGWLRASHRRLRESVHGKRSDAKPFQGDARACPRTASLVGVPITRSLRLPRRLEAPGHVRRSAATARSGTSHDRQGEDRKRDPARGRRPSRIVLP